MSVRPTSVRIRAWSALCVLLTAVCSAAGAPEAEVAAVTKSPAIPKVDAEKLRSQGIESALAGHFDEGLDSLRRAVKAAPDDKIALKAARLLEEYLKRWHAAAKERQTEYAHAVKRVGHNAIAQEYVEKVPEGELETFRKGLDDVVSAYNESGTFDTLVGLVDKKEAGEMKAQSVKALGEALEALAKTLKPIAKKKGPYAETLRSVATRAEELLEAYREAWQGISTKEPRAWRSTRSLLKPLEYDVIDVLSHLEGLASKKPWRVGLAQGRLAARLTPDKDKLAQETWFVRLVQETEARGKQFVKDAKWYDALSAYLGLKELQPDSEHYQKMVKIVERHVRVLGLYGQKQPTTQSKDAEEPQWRELVANVDADMVEKVIGQIDLAYVSSVDYRKVTRGALTSIKVLAETPQAGNSFAGLKDDKKRKEFLAAIDRQLREVDKRDRVMHLDLILALNSVLHVSEQTVNIPTEVLAVEFTDGFLDELDRFSSMIWPHDVPDFEKQTMGHFHGVGIQITKEATPPGEPGKPLRVVTPLIGTPAYRAGIKAGDLIVKVDGRETRDMTIDKLVQLIMGKKGTQVVLTIKRRGRPEPFDAPITRDQIHIRTVRGWLRQPRTGVWDHVIDAREPIGYLRVTQFTGQTPEHMVEALREMRKLGARSVILDLRFNPGGLLGAAARAANEFLIAGRIVSTRGRRTRPSDHNANPVGRYLDGDLVVLVNQYSASAAEIVSGALKDWKRAKIIGERTYGKGSVQRVISIHRHSALLKLTTAYYYLPRGRLLHRKNGAKDWGVDPDVEVQITPRQARRWLDIRRKTDIIQDVEPEELRADLARQYDADIQLNTAVLMLKLMRLRHGRSAA